MIIKDIKTESFRWERQVPISNGKHTYNNCVLNVVKILTDEGITGYGYGDIQFVGDFREMLIGQDPLDNEKLWHMMWVPKLVGRRGISTRTVSAIDIALWDIKSKACGLPLYKLLGGFRSEIPVYVAGGYYAPGKDISALKEEMGIRILGHKGS